MLSALEHYDKAMQFWQDKEADSAITELKLSIELDPNYRTAIFNLACIYTTKGWYEEALKEFRSLIQADPNDATIYQYIGKLFCQKAKDSQNREDWRSAQDAYRQSLALSPNNADALDQLAMVLLKLGEFAEAARTSSAAAAIAPKDRKINFNQSAIGGEILRQYISKRQWKQAWLFWMETWHIERLTTKARRQDGGN